MLVFWFGFEVGLRFGCWCLAFGFGFLAFDFCFKLGGACEGTGRLASGGGGRPLRTNLTNRVLHSARHCDLQCTALPLTRKTPYLQLSPAWHATPWVPQESSSFFCCVFLLFLFSSLEYFIKQVCMGEKSSAKRDPDGPYFFKTKQHICGD